MVALSEEPASTTLASHSLQSYHDDGTSSFACCVVLFKVSFARRVSKYFKYTPGVSCLLGPLDAEAKIKKQVQRIARKPVGEVVAPKILEVEDLAAQVSSRAIRPPFPPFGHPFF